MKCPLYCPSFMPYVKIIVDLVIKNIFKKNKQKHLTNKCSYVIIILTHYEFMCCAVRKGVVGRKDVARSFVPFCGFGQDNYRRLP